MKKIAVIPARYAATRFPGKLMQQLGDKTVIRMTYENVVATNLLNILRKWMFTRKKRSVRFRIFCAVQSLDALQKKCLKDVLKQNFHLLLTIDYR